MPGSVSGEKGPAADSTTTVSFVVRRRPRGDNVRMDLYIYLPESVPPANIDAIRFDLEKLRYFVDHIEVNRSTNGDRFAVVHTADPDNVFAADIIEVLERAGFPVGSVDYRVRVI